MLPTLKTYKIDWKNIIDNATKKKYWGVTWTVFEYNDVVVTVSLYAIEIENEKVTFTVNAKNKKYSVSRNNWYSSLSMKLEKKFIDQKMNTFIYETLLQLESRMIEHTSLYQEAVNNESEQVSTLTDIASNYLDNNNISLSDVRDAYIDRYVSDNTRSYTSPILNNLRYKLLTSTLLTFNMMTGRKEEYNNIKNTLEIKQKEINKIRKQITEMMKNLEDQEYIEELENNLESL